MPTTAPDLVIDRLGPAALAPARGVLLGVYARVYADRLDDPFFSLSRYWGRLEAYADRTGFALVTGSVSGEVVGYALGYTLPDGSGWWRGLRTEVDPELLREDGRRTFALNEVMVVAEFRRRGYARRLHHALLNDRAEERATLLVLPDNVPAQAAYASWGWYKLGELRPFDDAPLYDAMLLDLP